MASAFFRDLKIIELSGVLAGPSVAMFFAELGAKVIKYENRNTAGDVTRSWKLSYEDQNASTSSYFASINYKKEYRLIDFHNGDELAALKKEIESCDILISNFKSGDDRKYGLDYSALLNINPSLIYGHISGFGENNSRIAYDMVLQAEAGYFSLNGEPGGNPVKLPVAFIDVLAAHQLKEGLLLAIINRNATKKGSFVHVSLFDTAVSSLMNQASGYLMTGKNPQRTGTLHPNIAPYGEIITSADQVQFVLAVGSDHQFQALCDALHIPNDNKNFATNPQRVIHRQELIEVLKSSAIKIDSKTLEQSLLNKNVPFGRINSLEEVFKKESAHKMIRTEIIDQTETKRVTSIAFKTDFLHD